MTALQWSLLAFALVASGGLLMVLLLTLGRGIPRWLGTAHGLAGLGALVLLFAVNLRGGAATPVLAWWALAVFLGGFVGGLLLFRVIFRDRATLGLAALHGSAGALGLFLLYRAAL